MSCHDIGRGLNSVVKVVIDLFDEGSISVEAARKIVRACRLGVYWCDGNEGEAIQSIYYNRCGKCLRKVPRGDHLFNVCDLRHLHQRDNSIPETDVDDIMDKGCVKLATFGLCEECFIQVCNEYYQNENAGEMMIKTYI